MGWDGMFTFAAGNHFPVCSETFFLHLLCQLPCELSADTSLKPFNMFMYLIYLPRFLLRSILHTWVAASDGSGDPLTSNRKDYGFLSM